MKKTILLASALISASLILSACGNANPVIPQNNGNGQTGPVAKGLVVANCEKLTTDLQKNNPKATIDEAYKAAADILFSDARKDEAKACCDKIADADAKKICRRE